MQHEPPLLPPRTPRRSSRRATSRSTSARSSRIEGVSLEVRAGQINCLLGDNGAGKSTLIKTLSGVHPPDEGTLAVDGTAGRASARPATRSMSGSRPSTRTCR